MADRDSSGSEPAAALAVPQGVERVLLRAAREPAFLEQLKEHGARAARDAGIELTAIEATLLDSIEPPQIVQMVESLPDTAAARRNLPPSPVATGIRPDLEPDRGDPVPFPQSKVSSAGIRPDFEPVRGSRPGVKVAVATGVVLAAGAGALLCVSGNRPDMPPPAAGPDDETEDPGAKAADAGEDAGGDDD